MECGSNTRQAYRLAAERIDGLMQPRGDSAPLMSPEDFSIRSIFEETVGPLHEWREAPIDVLAEAVTSSAFPEITNRIFHNAVIPEYELNVGPLGELVTEDNATKTQSEEVAGYTPMDGDLELRAETMPYMETEFGEKKVRVYTGDFGRKISLTREAIFDDRTGQLLQRAKGVGEIAGQHRARMIMQSIEMNPRTAFNESVSRAFVYKGTTIALADFYKTDHSAVTGLDEQVNSNTFIDPPDTVGFTNAMDLGSKMVNENGDEILVSLKDMIVPARLWPATWRMTASPDQPDTTNRAWNFFGPNNSGRPFNPPMTSPFLATDYYWYIGNFKRQLLWLWVWKPATATLGAGTDIAFNNQIISQFRFNYYGGVGHMDYRFILRGGKA